jgi:hypothetical protein
MKDLRKFIKTTIREYLNENKKYENFFVIYDTDKFVSHITSETAANKIIKNGFRTGEELNVAEKRNAIFFSDNDVNYGLYARNKEGETYEGEKIGEIIVNIKGLKLLNMTYKENGNFINYDKYKNFNVKGELEKIPYDIDGTISFLDDGRIYEVALKKDVANRIIVGKK